MRVSLSVPRKSPHIRTLPSDIAGITCCALQRVFTLHANSCQAQNLTCRLLFAGKLRTYNRPRFPGSALRCAAIKIRHKVKPEKASQTLKQTGANPCTLKNGKCDYDRRYSDISSPFFIVATHQIKSLYEQNNHFGMQNKNRNPKQLGLKVSADHSRRGL